MPAVRLENVSRSFGDVAAVRDVSLTIRDGAFVTFLGPSGCGKTTTLRMIAGLEQNNTGRIAIGDVIVSVYFRPASRRVADFCGSPNIFTGTVAEVRATGNGVRLVKVEGNGGSGWSQSGSTLSPGDKAAVVVRPEAAEIVRRGTPASDTPSMQWDGSIAQHVFRGFRRTLFVRAGDSLMTVDAPADQALPIGEEVTVRIQAKRTWALPEQSGGGA